MEKIKQVFDGLFSRWDIQLPEADLQARASGAIHQNGWTIRYRFDREGEREFIEYFASHRLTNDTLNRIYADGEQELVGFCDEFYVANDPEAKRAYEEHNRRFYEEVQVRGLGGNLAERP